MELAGQTKTQNKMVNLIINISVTTLTEWTK